MRLDIINYYLFPREFKSYLLQVNKMLNETEQ